MSASENKATLRRRFDEFDRGNIGIIDELCASEYVGHFAGEPGPLDRAGLRRFASMFYTGFPDIRHHIEDQVAEGDLVVCRMTVRGTHQGEFQGLPPTGRPIAVAAINISRLDRGKVVEEWVNFDAMGLLQQLGALPMPAPAGA